MEKEITREALNKAAEESGEFDRICDENRKKVASWPKWMRCISITSETASTGNFIDKDKEKSLEE